MKLIIIAAMAKNRTIGKDNKIPWHIPEETRFFKKTTMGHAIIMGRKTYESIASPLSGRVNVVLTNNKTLNISGCRMVHNLQDAIECCRGKEKAFIIGGRAVYQEAMNIADSIFLTILEKSYEGDTFFPHIPSVFSRQVAKEYIDEANESFTLYRYERQKNETFHTNDKK